MNLELFLPKPMYAKTFEDYNIHIVLEMLLSLRNFKHGKKWECSLKMQKSMKLKRM